MLARPQLVRQDRLSDSWAVPSTGPAEMRDSLADSFTIDKTKPLQQRLCLKAPCHGIRIRLGWPMVATVAKAQASRLG